MEKMLGVMLDCSKYSVLKPETVKDYATIIKKMGYNTLMLYTEDTYEIPGQPYFGHLRGRYSCQELREMDQYCREIGIELIPCIQTLAHLKKIFNWQFAYQDVNDCDGILLVGEEKTYALIEEMIKTVSSCFTSKRIHIGMDEAFNLGAGEYEARNGHRDRFDIINEHLHRVCEIVKKYGMEPMVWSDMFCKLAANQGSKGDQYEAVDTAKILEKAALPEEISLVYWDYYHLEEEHYREMLERNKLFRRPVYFCGGAWTWRGFAPDNTYSIQTTDAAVPACLSEGIDGCFFSIWGDGGAECSPYAVLPALMFAAERVRGNTNMESIKQRFREIVGMDFDDFVLLDSLDLPGGNHAKSASRYLLFNDPFMGIRDYRCSLEDGDYYARLKEKIQAVKYHEKFRYLFEFYTCLADTLGIKATLGIRTREAYLNRDMEMLRSLLSDYQKAVEKLQTMHRNYETHWYSIRKPHGFEVQEARLGGLMLRLSACRTRLEKLISGEIDAIPELEEPVLEQDIGIHHSWESCITVQIDQISV